ncbi:MAG: hypothetical protein RMJ55_11225 [Roseiflexaceae bacterium]|nr:hypothetical protein [Roseiflexus sp.]MDW8214120.1 hypothetical protein [Roseiflexaceae bacterium]
MTVIYTIDPAAGWSDQVGLYLRCSPTEAQAIHRALRTLFRGRMSPLLPGRRSNNTFVIFVPATQPELERRWAEVLTLAGITRRQSNVRTVETAATAAPRSAGVPAAVETASTATPRPAGVRDASTSASTAAPHSASMHEWERRFREALRLVLASEKQQVHYLPSIDLVETTTNVNEAQDALLLEALSPSRHLRIQIARYAQRGAHAEIVALCAQRRQEILALPASDLLVTQLFDAHLHEAQRCNDPGLVEAGRDLALAFLPELERLRQANGIRQRLHQADAALPFETSSETVTLKERLAQLLNIAPADRLSQLAELHRRYPGASPVRIALADTHAALGHIEQALELYRQGRTPDDTVRAVTLLLATGQVRDALKALDAVAGDAPRFAGLRGATLAALGEDAQARPLLERAWNAGEQSAEIALAYARVLAKAGDLDRAAEPYQIAFESIPERFDARDYRTMAEIAAGGGYGDLTGEEEARYLDRYLAHIGRQVREQRDAATILQRRVELRRAAEVPDHLRISIADWLECLAERGDVEGIDQATRVLRDLQREGALSYQDQFELLEGVESFAIHHPYLSELLALEYQAIAVAELNLALRQVRPMPAYIADLQRALHFLNRDLADELAQTIEQERQALLARRMPAPETVIEATPPLSLAHVLLAIAGGHSATRREIERELREHYGLVHYQEMAPSSEDYIDRTRVRERLASASLIVVIAGYSGHDLTNLVRDLQRSGDIVGTVIWPKCRGKSGVVREIIAAAHVILKEKLPWLQQPSRH